MAEIWAAAIAAVGVAASAASAGYAIANAPGTPKTPDLAGASRAGVEAQAETLADRRRLEAAAQQGISTQYQVHAHDESVPFIKVPLGWKPDMNTSILNDATSPLPFSGAIGIPGLGDLFGGGGGQKYELIKYNAADWKPGGKYNKNGQFDDKWIAHHTENHTSHVPASTQTADFTGFGQADVQGEIARKNAQNLLDLQDKYGPGFIEEALKEEALADPQGTAARQREYDLIKEQEDANPDRPVANLLQQQVSDQLKAGKGLDNVSDSVLREAVGQAQASRGGAPANGSPDFSEPLTTGFEGERRLSAAEQKALGWLTSGATPEDVQYRREQQTLADLSSFEAGRTPESQFAALSGAQQGPAPFNPGTPLAQANPNAGAQGQNAALAGWGTSLQQANNTANPWLAGLSAAVRGAGAVSSLGGP